MGADYVPLQQEESVESPAPVNIESNVASVEALQETMTEMQIQIRRSSMWVYYMITVQVVCRCTISLRYSLASCSYTIQNIHVYILMEQISINYHHFITIFA